MQLKFKEVKENNFSDLKNLFGEKGACGGCWCMYWRITAKEFEAGKGKQNKARLEKIIKSGIIPGLLGYDDKTPVAWCSVAPREHYPRLENSRILKAVDDQSVWSIVCFYINNKYRKQGVSVELLQAAVKYVKKSGGKIVEGYPSNPGKKWGDAFLYMGHENAFIKAGFKEVKRRSAKRPIMRYYL